MKYLKFLSLISILVGSFFIAPKSSDAHYCTRGSETQGYLLFCDKPKGHAGPNAKNGIKFYFEDNFPSSYRQITMSGLQRWNQTGVVSFNVTTPSYTKNVIKTHYNANTSMVASVNIEEIDGNDYNHIKRWFMTYNTFRMAYITDELKIATATHEFGHTIGLDDLRNDSSVYNIMYQGLDKLKTRYPSSDDITGAKEAMK